MENKGNGIKREMVTPEEMEKILAFSKEVQAMAMMGEYSAEVCTQGLICALAHMLKAWEATGKNMETLLMIIEITLRNYADALGGN